MGGFPFAALLLALALALGCAHPLTRGDPKAPEGRTPGSNEPPSTELPSNDTAPPPLCDDDVSFDAATLDENGTLLLFRGPWVWSSAPVGAPPQPLLRAELFPELGAGPVDAALRLRREENRSLVLLQGSQVWAYAGGQLLPGYPRAVREEFPGIPDGVDAAVECPPEECGGETVLFFKGSSVLAFDVGARAWKARAWAGPGPCDSALRWRERHFCLRGASFTRFGPRHGDVPPGYPRDIRDYFIPCPGRGHGNASWGTDGDPCSQSPIQALLSDHLGHLYAFRGPLSFRLDSPHERLHPWPLAQVWPGLGGGAVDAAFTWEGRGYIVQGSQVFIFLLERGHRQVLGSPRALQDELGVPSMDAAFICPGSSHLYVISGAWVRRVDLSQSPRQAEEPRPLPHPSVDAATCTGRGVLLVRGPSAHRYASAGHLLGAREPSPPESAARLLFHCAQ